MKKWGYFISVLIIVSISLLFIKSYYPPLPTHSISKSFVLDKIKTSNGHLVELTTEYGLIWYISEMKYKNEFNVMMKDKGWVFEKMYGPSFRFKSKRGSIGVMSYKWNKKYLLYSLPNIFI